jgi:signal transduction histidine kinase
MVVMVGVLCIVGISLSVMAWRGMTELDRLIDRDLETLVIAYEEGERTRLETQINELQNSRFALLPDFHGRILDADDMTISLNARQSERGFVTFDPAGPRLRARATQLNPDTIIVAGRSLSKLQQTLVGLALILLICAGLSLFLGAAAMNNRKRQIERRVTALADAMDQIRRHGDVTALPQSGQGDELDRISKAAETMARNLSRRAANHREFSEQLAHELRTPLARLSAQLSDQSTDQPDDAIRRQIAQVSQALGDMLELASIQNDAGQPLQRQAGQTAIILQETIELFEDVIDESEINLQLTLKAQPDFAVQPELFRRLAVNLLDNALSHCDPGGTVNISHDPESGLVLQLANSGTGFPDTLIDNGPSRFGRFIRPGMDRKSTGLGLAFADAIALAHGWDMRLDNQDGYAVISITETASVPDHPPT